MAIINIFLVFSMVSCALSDVYINQPGYIYYKQSQKTSQYNVFEIAFRTIDATGMLLHAQSVEKGDYLTIELVRGKIRYAGEFGNGPINVKKQIKGYHEMYVGQDLADNQWHTVKVTQNTQDITIIIDGRREPRYFGFRRAPPAPTDFSVEEVFVGGLYSYVGVSKQRSVSQEGESLCIRSAHMSYFMNGIMNNINLITQRSGVQGFQSFCQAINYYPIFFPNKVSHLSYRNYVANSIKLKFDFRTVIAEQIVANYTNKLTKVLDLTIDREGRLVLGATVETTGSHLIMKTAKPNLHDGKWHTAEFFISNREPNYDAEFTVDGIKRRAKFMNRFIFDGGPLHMGFGFTGCMKNFFLNDRALDYTQLQKVSIIMGKCNLKDFCTPNPCVNGGKCNQTDTFFQCDCRHIAYKGSCCSESRFNYTCTEIHEKAGQRFKNDKYWLDMDGVGSLEPVRAFCRTGRTPQETITQINTTIPFDVSVINPTGRKIIPVTYLADEESLRQLLLHFKTCRQYIRYRCARSALFNSPTGPKQVQWMGFDDKLHYYWGGSGGRRGYCACGITRTCRNNERHCNCDALLFQRNIEDRGYLTIKEHLPVRRIDYFDVMAESGKEGISSIGALECWGTDTESLAATFREPWSYLQIELTSRNNWNNYIDASGIRFEFLTTKAEGVIVFSRGAISGDFLQIRLIGRTRARATINLGYYKNMNLDVDIARLNRTFDDNLPHKLELDFNRKEMNFTVDNITRIVEFHYQYGITHLDLDGSPIYVGGRNDGLEVGFMGIVRALYYGGKLVNLPKEAVGLSNVGVYPGQGSACKLVPLPCNQGFCIEEYNKYQCNCSVSPFSGLHCQLDEKAMVFQSGRNLEYRFQKKVQVQEAYINLAFKTSQLDAIIFQLHGLGNSHITLVLQAGDLKLLFNFKSVETDVTSIQLKHPKVMGKFNDNQRHVIRVHHKNNQMYAYVLNDNNNPISAFRNISGPAVFTSFFPQPASLSIGKYTLLVPGIPTSFVGCISGLRYQYLPQNAHVGINIDMQNMLVTKNANLFPSNPPPTNGSCGSMLPLPPPLPAIVKPQQFNFRNPVVTVAPIGSQFTFAKVIIVIIIVILATLAIILLFVTLNCITKHRLRYKKKDDELKLLFEKKPASKTATSYRKFEPAPEPAAEIPLEKMAMQSTGPQQAYSTQAAYDPSSISYAPNPVPPVTTNAAAAPSPAGDEDDDDGFFL